MWKKIVLLLLCARLYCVEFPSSTLATGKQNTNQLFNSIDMSLDLLEQEQNNMTKLLAEQKKSTAELEKAYQDNLLLYQDLESKYNNSKKTTAIWRTYSMIITGVAITTTTILLVNK